ncbi:MAG: hypothetical protein V8T90_13400 [Victivallales bacterium]
MNYLNGDDIREKFGVPVAMVKRHLHAEDTYYPETRIAEIVKGLRAKGWKPESKRCLECGEWKEKRSFYPMDHVCKFCRSKLREVNRAGSEAV